MPPTPSRRFLSPFDSTRVRQNSSVCLGHNGGQTKSPAHLQPPSPARMLNRGARGLCHRGNNAGVGRRAGPPAAVQSGWPPGCQSHTSAAPVPGMDKPRGHWWECGRHVRKVKLPASSSIHQPVVTDWTETLTERLIIINNNQHCCFFMFQRLKSNFSD